MAHLHDAPSVKIGYKNASPAKIFTSLLAYLELTSMSSAETVA